MTSMSAADPLALLYSGNSRPLTKHLHHLTMDFELGLFKDDGEHWYKCSVDNGLSFTHAIYDTMVVYTKQYMILWWES